MFKLQDTRAGCRGSADQSVEGSTHAEHWRVNGVAKVDA